MDGSLRDGSSNILDPYVVSVRSWISKFLNTIKNFTLVNIAQLPKFSLYN